MKLTADMLQTVPMWFLDRMTLPRGAYSPAEQLLARQEIKRRCGWPDGAVKMPPRETIDGCELVPMAGGGWRYKDAE